MGDLLPCPFCGSGIARTVGNAGFSGVELMGSGTDRPFVWCGTCGSAGSFEDSDDKAVTAWNLRAIPAADARPVQDDAASRRRKIMGRMDDKAAADARAEALKEAAQVASRFNVGKGQGAATARAITTAIFALIPEKQP